MGLLDSIPGMGFDASSTGTAGLLTPQDKLMALFSGLTNAGVMMAQPGLGKGQALAMGLGGLGQGIQQGNQSALQQRLFLERLAQQQRQQQAQDKYLKANPQHAALARAVGPEAFKTLLDRSIPKQAEVPFGFEKGPNGVTQTPGAFNTMAELERLKSQQRTEGERSGQNAVPLTTESPEFKAKVAGATETAQQQAQMPFVGPRAAATEAAQLPYAGPKAFAVADAQQRAQGGQRAFTQEGALRDDFTKLTQDFRTVQDAYNKIGEAAKAPTGAGDMSLLYSYVKLLDPGSVVRESEFATAAASGSFGERIQGLVSRIISGERLPDSLRKDFLDQAKGIYGAQKKGYDNVTKQYETLAKNYGVNPANVTTRFDTPEAVQPPAGATPPAGSAPPAGAAPRVGQTITNPTTGERRQWDGTQWAPIK